RPVLPSPRSQTTAHRLGLYPVGWIHRNQTTDRAGVTLRRAIVGMAARSTHCVSLPDENLGHFVAHRRNSIDGLRCRHRVVVWLGTGYDNLQAGSLSIRPLWPIGARHRLDR